MLVDEVTIRFAAGNGGRGAAAFNRVRLSRGPTGGSGGRGGSIYLEGISDIGALASYAHKKEVCAENGKDGRGQFLDGRAGEDLVLKIPIGTSVINVSTGYVREMERVGQRILVVAGGEGGRGNFLFRSGTNTSPKQYEDGTPGDAIEYTLRLKLIADIGLVGLPNAGKSSLLNALTSANSKVGSYAFTTLEPSLGAYYGLVIADIPGLIEGASSGKGLGTRFLQHIERTRALFHLVAADSDDVLRDYRTIRQELEAYNSELVQKREYVFISKSDTVSPEELAAKQEQLKKAGIKAHAISVLDDASLETVRALLNTIRDAL